MNSLQIKCFLEGASCLNFTKAAANLYITQPAFSRNIAMLEEEWGFELFFRGDKRKSTRLSPAGAVMYEGLCNLSDNYHDLLERAVAAEQGKTGTLVIGFLEAEQIDEKFLDAMDQFKDNFPDIEISFKSGSYRDLIDWLQDGTLDIAVTLLFDVHDKEWICYEELYDRETVLAVSVRHPLANTDRKELSLLDFEKDTFLGIADMDSSNIKNLLFEECQKVGFYPKVIAVRDIKTQILNVESQSGVAVVNEKLIEANKLVKPVKLKELFPVTVVLAWNKENYNPAIACFYSFYLK